MTTTPVAISRKSPENLASGLWFIVRHQVRQAMQAFEVRKAFIHCGLQLPAEMSRYDMNGTNEGERVFSHSNNSAPTVLLTSRSKWSCERVDQNESSDVFEIAIISRDQRDAVFEGS